MRELCQNLLNSVGTGWLNVAVTSTLLISLTIVSYGIAKKYLLNLINGALTHKQPKWKKILKRHQPFKQLVYMVPTLFLYFWVQYLPIEEETTKRLTQFLNSYIIVNVTLLLGNLISAVGAIYKTYPISREKPIKTYLQLLSIFSYFIGIVTSIFVLLDINPVGFLGSVSVLTTVLLFVFKDTILSFIAGMQIVSNNLIQNGDWIEAPQFGADGSVIEVALHVVKIQNWDKTIVSIPTYKLVDSGFKNWRGMYNSGGRRIKRALLLDQTSVRLIGRDELSKILKAPQLADTFNTKEWAEEHKSGLQTNLGAFRSYVQAFLRHHPQINQDLTFIIRLLDPTPQGVPLEIYVFTNDTAWSVYERIQAEIFEQLIATIPLFGLRIFQDPTGYDYILSGSPTLAAANTEESRKQAPGIL
ncbi:MAG: mechanosensitive ion channel domain-containing protein [Pseudomonadota bacterium]